VPTLASSSRAQVRYIEESAFGVTPNTGTARNLRITGESLDFAIRTDSSKEIRSDRMKPDVTIVSPTDGSEYVVNNQVLVSVTASDSIGVTRIQLFANDSIVKTVSSESLSGDRTLPAVLDYTPRAAGTVNLRVIALVFF